MRIYTGKGDEGKSSLADGRPVDKSDIRLALLGTLDELTSHIGLAKSRIKDEAIISDLQDIQHKLMTMMAHAAAPGQQGYSAEPAHVRALEQRIDRMQAVLPAQTSFVLPGQSETSALLDIARTVARRAERHMAAAQRDYPMEPPNLQYINRLSDYLYILARYLDMIGVIEKAVLEAIHEADWGTGHDEVLNLSSAKRVAQRIETKASETGLAAVICIAGPDGRPILVHVMDGAYLVSFEVAQCKAYTAVALKMHTSELQKLVQPGQMFYGLESLKQERILAIGGGVPLLSGDRIIGGIGISGGTDQQDAWLANEGKEFFTRGLS